MPYFRFPALAVALLAGAVLLSAGAAEAKVVKVCHVSVIDPGHSRTLRLRPRAARAHLSRHLRDFIGACCPPGLLCGGGAAPPPEMVLDVADPAAHPFVGIGTDMLAENSQAPADEVGTVVNRELTTPLVRTVVGPDWNQMPDPPVTPAGQAPDAQAFYDYVAKYFPLQPSLDPAPWNLSNAKDTINANHARGASIVLGFFSIPGAYRDAVGLVDVADFAAFWIALLQYLKDQGIDLPQYLELANEPNVPDMPGQQGYISPQNYGALVVAVADGLAGMASSPDYAALAGIGIIGPGVNVMEAAAQADGTIQWVRDLPDAAVARLAGWSAHAWNDNDVGVLAKWGSFIDTARARADLPFFVTEFATVGLDFPGAPLPDGCTSLHSPTYDNDGCAASNSTGYGVRVVENALAMANLGVSGALFWLADDKDGQAWGLVAGTQAGAAKRPAFFALQSLIGPLTSAAGGCGVDTAAVQSGWTALAPSWDPTVDVPGAGFFDEEVEAVVVSLVNPTAASVTQAVEVRGATIPDGAHGGCAYSADGLATASVSTTANAFTYTLPANSTFTVRLPIDDDLDSSEPPDGSAHKSRHHRQSHGHASPKRHHGGGYDHDRDDDRR